MEPAHVVATPEIVPGVAGAAAVVVTGETAADDVPQVLVAVTEMLPDVAPNVTVTEVVP